eukprot:2353055-Pyramimonas_sp.AAC.1
MLPLPLRHGPLDCQDIARETGRKAERKEGARRVGKKTSNHQKSRLPRTSGIRFLPHKQLQIEPTWLRVEEGKRDGQGEREEGWKKREQC